VRKKVIKRGCAGAKVRGQAKKDVFFLDGEVFFLLPGPLMGDPISDLTGEDEYS